MSGMTMGSLGVRDSLVDENEDIPLAGDSGSGVKRYYGKYRGTVLPMVDVDLRGRLLVQVTDVHGPNFSGWARPCLPWAGPSMGCYSLPPPGTNVWIEFEHGHPDYAIWVGCWWGSPMDAPTITKSNMPLAPIFALETIAKHAFIISDTPVLPYLPFGGVLLRSGACAVAVDVRGVRILGPTVQINGMPDGTVPTAAALLVT